MVLSYAWEVQEAFHNFLHASDGLVTMHIFIISMHVRYITTIACVGWQAE